MIKGILVNCLSDCIIVKDLLCVCVLKKPCPVFFTKIFTVYSIALQLSQSKWSRKLFINVNMCLMMEIFNFFSKKILGYYAFQKHKI